MIRILIADDHAIVRQGLKQIVADESDMRVAGEAENANEVVDFVRKHPCDVVVQDISLPGRDGLEVLRDLKHEFPRLPVLMLSVHPQELFGVRALRLGAAGYLTKKAAPAELVAAIRTVVGGRKYVPPSLVELLADHLATDDQRLPHETLSNREYQVMCMIAAGRKAGDIAAELSLSVKSINTYRARVLEKMGVKSNAELTRYALQHRLLD